jgi:hypothetical protein
VRLLEKLKARRRAKREDRAAIARARQESARAGDEPPPSMADTVDGVSGQYPAPS